MTVRCMLRGKSGRLVALEGRDMGARDEGKTKLSELRDDLELESKGQRYVLIKAKIIQILDKCGIKVFKCYLNL